jgi:hypothetical protein
MMMMMMMMMIVVKDKLYLKPQQRVTCFVQLLIYIYWRANWQLSQRINTVKTRAINRIMVEGKPLCVDFLSPKRQFFLSSRHGSFSEGLLQQYRCTLLVPMLVNNPICIWKYWHKITLSIISIYCLKQAGFTANLLTANNASGLS